MAETVNCSIDGSLKAAAVKAKVCFSDVLRDALIEKLAYEEERAVELKEEVVQKQGEFEEVLAKHVEILKNLKPKGPLTRQNKEAVKFLDKKRSSIKVLAKNFEKPRVEVYKLIEDGLDG